MEKPPVAILALRARGRDFSIDWRIIKFQHPGMEVIHMSRIFPEPISNLPEADIPLKGVKAFLSQGDNHQILFMEFEEDVNLPEHFHECQWGVVLEGRIDLVIDGIKKVYTKGDRYFIPKGVKHSGKIDAGYADITFFNVKDRYKVKGDMK
jgi:quercetin dioxygenase-like cupin family protein